MNDGSAPGSAEPQLGSSKTAKLGFGVPRWYSRGYLPHFDHRKTLQSVTFRLADSLPQSKLQALEQELRLLNAAKVDAERRKRIEAGVDSGLGCCALGQPKLAALMQQTLLKWDGDRYRLFAWCIMPNHVPVLMETLAALPKIVQSRKSFTGRWAMQRNAELGLSVPGESLRSRPPDVGGYPRFLASSRLILIPCARKWRSKSVCG